MTCASGPPIGAELVSYTIGEITNTGIATYPANDPTDLTAVTPAVTPAVTASEITGDNTATWSPTITVAVPGCTVAGTYSETITSVL